MEEEHKRARAAGDAAAAAGPDDDDDDEAAADADAIAHRSACEEAHDAQETKYLQNRSRSPNKTGINLK
jgi:hypothetical protein